MKKPSERILEVVNALKALDGKKAETDFSTYDAKAFALWLDETFELIDTGVSIRLKIKNPL